MSDNASNNKRLARNTLFLYLRMFFVLVVSLYTSRVVLNVLGVSDYGLYNVVAGFVSLFGFLNATLSSSMQRFYNYEGGCRGNQGYKDVYCTGFWIHVLLAIIILFVLETVGLWYINNVMVIPSDRLLSANILFQFSIVSMAIVILQVPYLSAILAKEKMDYYAIVSIVDVVLKLLIVIILPYVPKDKLIVYGTLSLIIAIADFLMYFIYAKVHFSYLKLGVTLNKDIFKSLLSFSGWNMLGTFAYLLKGQGINVVLNAFFSTIINAARGVAFQVNGAISGFNSNIATAFRPQLVDAFAKKDTDRTRKLMFSQSKLCYCLILVLIVPVILEMDNLLDLWLGDAVPENTNIYSSLVLVDLLICTLNTPVTQVAFATGNIKKYQIYNSIVNLLLIPACVILLKFGCNATSVFVVTIIFSIINQVVCLIKLHKIFEFSYTDYFNDIILPCIFMTLLLPILPIAIRLTMNSSILRFLMIVFADVILAFVVLYYCILNKSEKNLLIKFVRRHAES